MKISISNKLEKYRALSKLNPNNIKYKYKFQKYHHLFQKSKKINNQTYSMNGGTKWPDVNGNDYDFNYQRAKFDKIDKGDKYSDEIIEAIGELRRTITKLNMQLKEQTKQTNTTEEKYNAMYTLYSETKKQYDELYELYLEREKQVEEMEKKLEEDI